MSKNSRRRHEITDPTPITLPVKFQKPPTLAEQIARFMGQQERYAAQQGHETPEEADDFDIPDDDAPESPHELVFDPDLNREIPRYEKVLLDRDRARFDSELNKKIRADQAAARAAEAALRRSKGDAMRKKKKEHEKELSESADEPEET